MLKSFAKSKSSRFFVKPKPLKMLHPNPTSPVLTNDDIKKLVNNIWGPDFVLIDYEIIPFSNEKLGFMASHNTIILRGTDPSTNENICKKLFLKMKPTNFMFSVIEEMKVFKKELIFYSEILPLMKEDSDCTWAPKCYLGLEHCLILEDLRESGFSMRGKVLTLSELTSVLSALAEIHAASLIAESKLDRPLNEVFPDSLHANFFFDGGYFNKWVQAGFNLAYVIAKNKGFNVDTMRTICSRFYAGLLPSKSKRNVFCHADVWSNNVLCNEDSPPKCVIVDYQMARYGPLMHDVFFLLFLCSTKEFREKHEKSLIKHYYTVLCEVLKKNKRKVQIPSWTEISQENEDIRLTCAILAMIYFPSILMDATKSAPIFTNSKKMLKHTFEDRVDNVLKIMQQDPQYEERIEQSVVEVYELGLTIVQ